MKNLILYIALFFIEMAIAQICSSKNDHLDNIYSLKIDKCKSKKNKAKNSKNTNAVIRSRIRRRNGYSKTKIDKKSKENNKSYNSRTKNMVVDSKVYEFSELDVIPLFKEDTHKNLKLDLNSFSKRISKYIRKSLKNSKVAIKNSTNTEILVQFQINSNGKIENIKATGPKSSIALTSEAERIVKNMKDFKPALKNGKPVNSVYYLSIPF